MGRPSRGPRRGGCGGHGAVPRLAGQGAIYYQSAVAKVLPYARGVTYVAKTGWYVQREDVPFETYDGRMLTDRQAVADDWSWSFSKRIESQDIGAVRRARHT